MPTPKTGIRIPASRWQAAQRRAKDRGSDASKVVNAALEAYLAGALDEVLAPLLARSGDGQTAQDPSLASGWARAHSPSAAMDST